MFSTMTAHFFVLEHSHRNDRLTSANELEGAGDGINGVVSGAET